MVATLLLHQVQPTMWPCRSRGRIYSPSLSTRRDPESPRIPKSAWMIRPFTVLRLNIIFSLVNSLEIRMRFPFSSNRFRSSPSQWKVAASHAIRGAGLSRGTLHVPGDSTILRVKWFQNCLGQLPPERKVIRSAVVYGWVPGNTRNEWHPLCLE